MAKAPYMSEGECLSFRMSHGSFVVNSCRGQSLKVGSFIALDQCNKFNLIIECSNTKVLLHVSVSHPFK